MHQGLRAYGRTPDLAGSEIRRRFSHPPLIGQRVAHAGNKLEAVDVLLLRRVRRWLLAKGTSCCGNKWSACSSVSVPGAYRGRSIARVGREARMCGISNWLSVDEWQVRRLVENFEGYPPRWSLRQCNTVHRPARFGCWHGNTGAEIALDCEHGAETTISIRGGVHTSRAIFSDCRSKS